MDACKERAGWIGAKSKVTYSSTYVRTYVMPVRSIIHDPHQSVLLLLLYLFIAVVAHAGGAGLTVRTYFFCVCTYVRAGWAAPACLACLFGDFLFFFSCLLARLCGWLALLPVLFIT